MEGKLSYPPSGDGTITTDEGSVFAVRSNDPFLVSLRNGSPRGSVRVTFTSQGGFAVDITESA